MSISYEKQEGRFGQSFPGLAIFSSQQKLAKGHSPQIQHVSLSMLMLSM